MPGDGRGLVDGHPAMVAGAQREVGLLGVQEVARVPAAQRLVALPTHQQDRPGGPGDDGRLVVGGLGGDVLAESGEPREAQAQGAQQGRAAPQGRRQLAVAVEHPGRDHADGGVVQPVEQGLDRSGDEHHVGVEDEDRQAGGEVLDPAVDACGVAVVGRLDDMGASVAQRGHRVVGGGVVDDDHLGLEVTERLREAVEQRAHHRTAVVGDHDHAHGSGHDALPAGERATSTGPSTPRAIASRCTPIR